MNQLRVLAGVFTCCPSDKPGFSGGEDQLGWNLLRQIARYHQVWAITNEEDRDSIEAALQEEPIPNLQFCYVGLPAWLHPVLRFQGSHQLYYHLWQLKAYFAAKRLHKQVQFNLFHHITYANDWLASFIGAFLMIPYVRGPGGGAHRTPKSLEKEYSLGGRLWEKVRASGQWVFRHDPFFIMGQKRARAILVCTKDSQTMIPQAWREKVHLFPVSGVSTEDLSTDLTHKADSTFRVLTAGSLIRVKGFGLAIKAFQEFAKHHPDTQFRIIGSGPEEFKLRAIADRSTNGADTRFIEAMPRVELLAEMAAADVFLFPSLRDGGGTVVIEAMSMGKPVICLDAGGPGMHINSECGLKVAPSTPQQTVSDLAASLERLYSDRDLRLNLGSAARKRAKQDYHWDKLGDRLMEIYRRAIDMDNGI